ncbi:transcription termination factor 2 isoform X5 [Takifugu rubripes]|uniref:transcription termination factor 2 isoform X5 n=1 Tax=Takifugu rubripes TaxID=31033 RepID=UPI001145C8CD|nr:transcription termination factor 2 isoform X5 [Takifugu rubripes]
MEKILCGVHGTTCMLKTGVKEGPSKGKSFYICVDKQSCDFSQPTSISPSHCLQHEDSVVELQALVYNKQQQSHSLFYRCIEGKNAGQRWCGNVPWSAPKKDKRNPLSHTQQLPSCLPSVRNPFKAPEKEDKDSEWRKMQGAGSVAKDGEACPPAEGSKARQKENFVSAVAEEEDDLKSEISGTYRTKDLPPGMKLKKKVPDKEKNSPKVNGGGKLQEKVNYASEQVPGEAEKNLSPSLAKSVNMKKVSVTTKDSDPKKPSTDKTCIESSPSSFTQASKDSITVHRTSDKPSQSTDSHLSSKGQDEDDVVLVSVKPAAQKSPATAVQKVLTTYPGFQPASNIKSQDDPRGLRNLLTAQLQQKKATLSAVNVAALPDKEERLRTQVRELEEALTSLSLGQASQPESQIKTCGSDTSPSNSQVNPFNRPGGTILLPSLPSSGPSQQASSSSLGLQSRHGSSQMSGANSQAQALYGGRMTEDRLMAVKNATCEAIDHLHKSLESCPGAEAESPDPRGLKVTLLPHQRGALAWLLWRETQNPCGGILADDMGLGKTLTMISLILTQKDKKKGEDKKKEKQLDKWLSKTDSTLVASKATLIICPASLIHHWKREIDRHVRSSKLSVYLYHGPNREKSARALADYDVVVTTYSLVSKEIPVQKEEAEKPNKDDVAPPSSSTLFRVAWERVVLDEAHNIKNPKVQTSMATCQLKAHARWAVTGTPIQNNLLDMYSLLKFLRCSPFDEFKLWKAQVDNGSRRGRERLNILTRSLLLRRTKDQKDAAGSPLVTLPGLMCKVHRPKLSQDEKKVYDGLSQTGSAASGSQQPQQASSTKDNLSVRLRQCCCHLSLLKETLDPSELNGDEIVVPLEEQLNALSLTSSPSQAGPKDTVTLFGTQFPSELFEKSSESTKISAILSELKKIRENDSHQKSVIVSQWTSMLRIVAVHLESIGLRYGIIDGDVNPEQRMDLVKEFNDNPKGPQVMLVSLRTQDGLNLIGGNHLFLTEMHWNPAIEDQACARIYRVGQTKDVTIHRFVCKDTVEEEISTLQVEKRKLAQNVLSGTGSTSTKLSLADLRKIFGV